MSRAVIFHHNDADGRCAAAIVLHSGILYGCIDEPVFVEMDYKDEVRLDLIDNQTPVYVLDFSFKPEIMDEVRKRAFGVIWCDHHKTAASYPYQDLPGVRDFSEKGLSGAECTWEYCFPDAPIPEDVVLLGDYDAWRLEQQPSCFHFYEGLKLFDTSPTSDLWTDVLGFAGADEEYRRGKQMKRCIEIREAGQAAIKYRDNYCANMRKAFGYETEIAGHKAYAINAYQFGSAAMGEKFKEYPVSIAYAHDGRKFTVSLYSTTVDVGEIAKSLGGGGHKGAAGFTCEKLPFERRG